MRDRGPGEGRVHAIWACKPGINRGRMFAEVRSDDQMETARWQSAATGERRPMSVSILAGQGILAGRSTGGTAVPDAVRGQCLVAMKTRSNPELLMARWFQKGTHR